MSRILYGSSNVYRNFSRSTLVADHGLVLVDCTKKALFDTHLASLGTLSSGSLIVTSVLENFIMAFAEISSPAKPTYLLVSRLQCMLRPWPPPFVTFQIPLLLSPLFCDNALQVSSLCFPEMKNDKSSVLVFSPSLLSFCFDHYC
jgi:hypothetical protein